MVAPKTLTQRPMQKFPSDCGKMELNVDNDTSLGALHDFLMLIKGEIVNRMVANQKQEEQIAEAQRAAQAAQEAPATEEKPAEPCTDACQPEIQAG